MNGEVLRDVPEGFVEYPYMYRALVEGVDDPLHAGRIQARVYPLFTGADAADLPWAKPAFPLGSGAGTGQGSFSVPDVGTYVYVMFEEGDYNQPVYFAEAATATKGIPSFASTHYPHRRGFKTASGVEVFVDDTDGLIQVTHPQGTVIKIDATGNVEVSAGPKNVTVAAQKVVVNSSNINLGDEMGGSLVKKTDLLLSQILITAPSGGGPCVVTDPTGLAGTQKVKGS